MLETIFIIIFFVGLLFAFYICYKDRNKLVPTTDYNIVVNNDIYTLNLSGNQSIRNPIHRQIEVVGESYKNSDGSDRQKIIKKLKPDDLISLRPEPNNKYSDSGKAVAVWSGFGQIGYLPEHDEDAEFVFEKLVKGESVSAKVLHILGGTKDKPHLGVWLDVNIS